MRLRRLYMSRLRAVSLQIHVGDVGFPIEISMILRPIFDVRRTRDHHGN